MITLCAQTQKINHAKKSSRYTTDALLRSRHRLVQVLMETQETKNKAMVNKYLQCKFIKSLVLSLHILIYYFLGEHDTTTMCISCDNLWSSFSQISEDFQSRLRLGAFFS